MDRCRVWTIYEDLTTSRIMEKDAIIDALKQLVVQEKLPGLTSSRTIINRDPESKDPVDEESAIANVSTRGWGSKEDRALVITVSTPPQRIR